VHLVDHALERALTMPSETVHAHVADVRRRHPEATPQQLVRLLEREYLLVVAGGGGVVGIFAAAPSVGTGVAAALTMADVATFFAASSAFALAIASVHGIETDDVERRKALLLATVLGESGVRAVGDVAEVSTARVARTLLTRMPVATVRKVNATLTRRVISRQAVRQGGLALGRLVPFGIGLVVGVTGGRALGMTVVEGARAAFGPPPAVYPWDLAAPPAIVLLPAGSARATPRWRNLVPHRRRRA